MTIWTELEEACRALPEPFSRQEILSWFRRHHPERDLSSVSAHIQVATSNAPETSRGAFLNRRPLLTRVGRGEYRRYRDDAESLRMPPHPSDQRSLSEVTATTDDDVAVDVLLAGSVSLRLALKELAARRPVFHSEADFQHALAWTVHLLDPEIEVRLETHPEPNVRLDMQLSRRDPSQCTAVELKYMTRRWSGVVNGEEFVLKNHGAQDTRGYDVIKDIERVERFIEGRSDWNGAVVALTNDPSYWRPSRHDLETNADAFRLREGNVLEGVRAWGPRTGPGTTSGGRDKPIPLRGRYTMTWSRYSTVEDPPTSLQVLVLPVGKEESTLDV